MVGVAVMSTGGEPDPTVIVVAGCEATEGESKSIYAFKGTVSQRVKVASTYK